MYFTKVTRARLKADLIEAVTAEILQFSADGFYSDRPAIVGWQARSIAVAAVERGLRQSFRAKSSRTKGSCIRVRAQSSTIEMCAKVAERELEQALFSVTDGERAILVHVAKSIRALSKTQEVGK